MKQEISIILILRKELLLVVLTVQSFQFKSPAIWSILGRNITINCFTWILIIGSSIKVNPIQLLLPQGGSSDSTPFVTTNGFVRSWPPSNTMVPSLDQQESALQNGISIGLPVTAPLTRVPNTDTADHATCDICRNRPHWCYAYAFGQNPSVIVQNCIFCQPILKHYGCPPFSNIIIPRASCTYSAGLTNIMWGPVLSVWGDQSIARSGRSPKGVRYDHIGLFIARL